MQSIKNMILVSLCVHLEINIYFYIQYSYTIQHQNKKIRVVADSIETKRILATIKTAKINSIYALLLSSAMEAIRAVTDFQYHEIFLPEFSVLPTKISEYLQADSPSDANTREMTDLHKVLNINNLHLETIFSPYNMHRFGMRYSPFQGLKCTISPPDIGANRG